MHHSSSFAELRRGPGAATQGRSAIGCGSQPTGLYSIIVATVSERLDDSAEVLRVFKTFSLAVLGAAALAAAVRAEGPAAPPAATRAVEQWVEQLGDSDYRKRDEASQALRDAGAAAIPVLRKALAHPDAEIRRRANELLPDLEAAVLLAPKRVTFKTVDKPAKAAFDELIRQTGYQIEYNLNDPNRLYSFDFQDAAFWEVVEKISRATGLVLQQGYGDDHVRLYQQDAYAPYFACQGAFRFTATGFNQYRNIDFGLVGKTAVQPQTRNETLTLLFSVFVEPKLALLGVGEAHLEAAYDNDKNCMLPPVNNVDLGANPWMGRRYVTGKYGNGNRMYSMQTQVNLQRPSDRATSLKVIRGALPVTLLVEEKAVVVTDKILQAKGTKAQIGDTLVNIDEVTETPGKQYQIKMSVTENQKDNPNDYSWTNSLYQRIELLDEKGNKMQVYGSQWNNSSANHVDMTLTYGAPGGAKPEPPAKLIYHTWNTEQHLIPFEFKDLPLP